MYCLFLIAALVLTFSCGPNHETNNRRDNSVESKDPRIDSSGSVDGQDDRTNSRPATPTQDPASEKSPNNHQTENSTKNDELKNPVIGNVPSWSDMQSMSYRDYSQLFWGFYVRKVPGDSLDYVLITDRGLGLRIDNLKIGNGRLKVEGAGSWTAQCLSRRLPEWLDERSFKCPELDVLDPDHVRKYQRFERVSPGVFPADTFAGATIYLEAARLCHALSPLIAEGDKFLFDTYWCSKLSPFDFNYWTEGQAQIMKILADNPAIVADYIRTYKHNSFIKLTTAYSLPGPLAIRDPGMFIGDKASEVLYIGRDVTVETDILKALTTGRSALPRSDGDLTW
jgi:hypothetical protein